jgi:hypothetical protein
MSPKVTLLHTLGALALALGACGDDGDAPRPIVSTAVIDFGQTDCGAVQPAQTIVLANPSFTLLHYEAAFEHGTQYMVQPPSGFLLPGQELALSVSSAAIPASSEVTDDLYGDTLTITTDLDGDAPHVIDIRQTARGAILAWDTASVSFPGTSKATDRAMTPLVLRNTGNAPARDVMVRGTAGFGFDPPTSAALAPGDLAGNAIYRPSIEGDETGTITVASASGLCQPLPAAVTVTGKGTFAGAAPIEVDLISGASSQSESNTLFARLPDGRVASLGSNQLGLRGANAYPPADTPTIVRDVNDSAVDDIAEVAGGRGAACARRNNGDVLCWGNVDLVRGSDVMSTAPQPGAMQVAAGASAIALTYGARCITANGFTDCLTNVPRFIDAGRWTPTDVKQLSIHAGGGYAVRADGSVVSFGSNFAGERGDPAAPTAVAPIPGLTGVKKTIATSPAPKDLDERGGCALKEDGTVWCWGSGEDGANGDGAEVNRTTPVQVMIDESTPLTGARDLAGSDHLRCAVTPDNLYCWGDIPDSDNALWASPVTEDPITDGISVTTLPQGACVLRSAGLITCFGETPLSMNPVTDYTGFMAPTP